MDLLYHMHTDIADMGAILKMIVYSNMASTSSEAAEASVAGLQQQPEPSTSSSSNSQSYAAASQSSATTADNNSSEPATAAASAAADETAEAAGSSSGVGGSGDSTYECTICLETAKDAVVSLCGHLFCWPCLHQWLETRPQRPTCPVCKSAISKDKVIPLYGRDTKNQQDPRTKEAPPRPTAQRSEPETSAFHGFGFPDGGGFHMSFGIGAFPFGFFTSTFNFGSEPRPVPTEEDQFLSKFFLWIGILFLAWLILA